MAKIERSAMTQTDSTGRVIREAKTDPLDLGKFTWWKEEDETKKAHQIQATVKFMDEHDSAHKEQLSKSTRLYGNSVSYGQAGLKSAKVSASTPNQERLTFNLCSSVVDTLVSKLAKNEVTPTFITSGGVWGMQRKAENLSKFIDGCFYENKIHAKITEAVSDSGVWGDAFLYVYRTNDDRVGVERVVPQELRVDNVETLLQDPRQKHRIKDVDRDVLMEMFSDDPEAQNKIAMALPTSLQDSRSLGSTADLLSVIESWHLPSGSKAKDGEHCFTVEDKILFKEPYDKPFFPFPHLRYVKRKFGYWGQGACERLQSLQAEINRNMITVQKNFWMFAGTKIAVENGSKVVTQHLTNETASIIHYTTHPPQYLTPPGVNGEIFPWIESLIQKGYQQEGVSQLAASNLKPIGIDSGAALRTYDQISDDRQLYFEKCVEAFALEIVMQMIEVAKDIYKDLGTYKVKWGGTNFIETIDWKDVALEKDEYVLKAFPTSSLPDDPASKLQTVQEYMQSGIITPRSGRRLLRMPDIEMSDKLANAAEELLCKTIEGILYDGEIKQPDGNWDLQLGKQLCLEYYNYAVLNNCPEENLSLLRDFQSVIDDQLGLNQPPPAAVPQAQPLANPEPTPTSDLVPNTAPQTQGVA